jgi:hypothetical protein
VRRGARAFVVVFFGMGIPRSRQDVETANDKLTCSGGSGSDDLQKA